MLAALHEIQRTVVKTRPHAVLQGGDLHLLLLPPVPCTQRQRQGTEEFVLQVGKGGRRLIILSPLRPNVEEVVGRDRSAARDAILEHRSRPRIGVYARQQIQPLGQGDVITGLETHLMVGFAVVGQVRQDKGRPQQIDARVK